MCQTAQQVLVAQNIMYDMVTKTNMVVYTSLAVSYLKQGSDTIKVYFTHTEGLQAILTMKVIGSKQDAIFK